MTAFFLENTDLNCKVRKVLFSMRTSIKAQNSLMGVPEKTWMINNQDGRTTIMIDVLSKKVSKI